MIAKIAGILLVLASSTLTGFYLSGLPEFRINDLSEFKKALTILKSEIEFAYSPLPEALQNISGRISGPVGKIFSMAGEKLRAKDDINVLPVWKKSIDSYKKYLYLTVEDYECLYSFGSTAGYLDKKMQIGSIGLLTDYIDGRIEFLRENQKKTAGMYKSLGILGGLLVAVIFI